MEEARTLLKGMLEKKGIRPSMSLLAFPIVLAHNNDGSTQFRAEYCKVNQVMGKDAYPLPLVDDTLDTLAGAKSGSVLWTYVVSGYWQVEVDKKDHPKTAFCTPDGLFEFNVMPFRLSNVSATYIPKADGLGARQAEKVILLVYLSL